MAVGLGSMDMPIPQVAAWEWVNWKFPKAVHAGETIFARWTLTQKRPPVHGSPTGIAVWHVDVMTADGAVCADGEVGATVFRRSGAHAEKPAAEPAAARPRRRRRRGSGQPESTAAAAAPPPPSPAPAAADRPPAAERPAGGSRRRRRKRGGSSGNGNGGGGSDHAGSAGSTATAEPAPAPAPLVATPAVPAAPGAAKGRLSQVMRRLRRT